MNSTRITYNERMIEIEDYYNALFYHDALGQISVDVAEANGVSVELAEKYKSDVFIKISKANALIMIYNLVESTVTNGIEEIYDKVKLSGATYSTVRKEIQEIWFSYKFGQVHRQPEANYKSYKSKAFDIVAAILDGEIMELNSNALPINGNMDASQIFKICNSHGIKFIPDKACKGGGRLADVKDKRNWLSHGNLSFTECGREYSLEDLVEIKEQTYVFLTGLLAEMGEYYANEDYRTEIGFQQPRGNTAYYFCRKQRGGNP